MVSGGVYITSKQHKVEGRRNVPQETETTMGTTAGWVAFGVCLVVLLVDDTSSSPLRETDTHSHMEKALNRLEKMFDILQNELRDLPSAEQADLVSAKQEQHERDISVPYPEVDDAPAKKSSVPPPMRDKIPATATASKDGGVEQEVVPTTKKDLSVAELKRLLKILQKRDYDIPFPVNGDTRRPME
ncbi:hypothetical protein LSAT2_008838 [Lamellibrachia satsuma]|nr:hypothetical protein LSAT2_008838 [Lamellibrachia satsuma]